MTKNRERASINMPHAQSKAGEIILRTLIFAKLETFKEIIAFLPYLMAMVEQSVPDFVKIIL